MPELAFGQQDRKNSNLSVRHYVYGELVFAEQDRKNSNLSVRLHGAHKKGFCAKRTPKIFPKTFFFPIGITFFYVVSCFAEKV